MKIFKFEKQVKVKPFGGCFVVVDELVVDVVVVDVLVVDELVDVWKEGLSD